MGGEEMPEPGTGTAHREMSWWEPCQVQTVWPRVAAVERCQGGRSIRVVGDDPKGKVSEQNDGAGTHGLGGSEPSWGCCAHAFGVTPKSHTSFRQTMGAESRCGEGEVIFCSLYHLTFSECCCPFLLLLWPSIMWLQPCHVTRVFSIFTEYPQKLRW